MEGKRKQGSDRQTGRQADRKTDKHTYIPVLTRRHMDEQINIKLTFKQILPIVPMERNYCFVLLYLVTCKHQQIPYLFF